MDNFSVSRSQIVMRRLFKYDIEKIKDIFKSYNNLFYNPFTDDFIINILLYGEFWGAFYNNNLIACNYIFPLGSNFFKESKTFSYLIDFISNPDEYLYVGYIGFDENCKKTLNPFFKTEQYKIHKSLSNTFFNNAEMQAFRQGFKYVLHAMPFKMSETISSMFDNKYILLKLRGLDNLVVHYIFVKNIFPKNHNLALMASHKSESVSAYNTKAVSKYLESGYCITDMSFNNAEQLFTVRKLINVV